MSRFRLTARLFIALAVAACATFSVVSAASAQVLRSDRVDGRSAKEIGLPKAAMPDVTMAAGALITEDGRVLWSRRSTDRRAMASITKVMTAVVAMENGSVDDLVTIPRASSTVGESTSFLRVGEGLPMGEVLEALLVKSGNDAGVAIAMHVSGSEEGFVAKMNEKAVELGLERTHFSNSHGLDEKEHYSTAEDLAVLVRYAMTKPEFRRIVGQKTATIGTGKRAEKVQTTNLLIGNYAGANGVKTGYTSDAGYCVVDSARRGDIELYAVVLGTTNEMKRFRDARDLLDFGFAHYRKQNLVSEGTVVGEARVLDYLDVNVPAAVAEDATVTVFDLAGTIKRTVSVSAQRAPVAQGQRIGVAKFIQGGEVIASVPLVATRDVERPGIFERVGIAIVRVWWKITGKQ